ncbi:MAG: hypothetical protein R6U20_11480, partial [Longimonas sp.]|uniref:hypothetical protein n=1 Tax=Longimonas sp. TaxID=2039626 RepID=UPI003975E1AB
SFYVIFILKPKCEDEKMPSVVLWSGEGSPDLTGFGNLSGLRPTRPPRQNPDTSEATDERSE